MNDKEAQDKIYREEATSANLTFVKRSKVNYGYFLCNKGHTIELQYTHVRRNNWKCKHCYEEKLREKANSIGYELIGKSTLGSSFRVYKKPCGCVEDLRISNVNVAKDKRETEQVTCRTCYRKSIEEAAEKSNITMLEDIDAYNIKIKFNSCGHYKIAKKAQLRRFNLECKECHEIHIKNDAETEGLEHLGSDPSCSSFRLYKLPCGCIKKYYPSDIQAGRWNCLEHSENSHYNKPCDLYVLLGSLLDHNFRFVKVGISNNTEKRVDGYKAINSSWFLPAAIGFDTKSEALVYEKEFHKLFKNKRLDPEEMRKHLGSGFTECYPVSMLSEILDYFTPYIARFGGSNRFKER